MITGPIENDDKVRHIRNGKTYRVMTANVISKQKDGVWEQSVAYCNHDIPNRMDDLSGPLFVRDELYFRKNFERVV